MPSIRRPRDGPLAPRPPDPPALGLAQEVAELWGLSPERLNRVLSGAGCPLCHALVGAVADFMDRLLGVRALPEPVIREIRAARGFCPVHAWRLHREAVERGLPATGVVGSIRDVLAQALAALGLYGEGGTARLDPTVFKRTVRYGWTKELVRRLEPKEGCPVCLGVRRIEETLGYQLLALLGRHEIRAGYRSDSALCLPHFRWALHAADKATLDCLVEAERERLASLLSDRSNPGWSPSLAHVVGVPNPPAIR